VLSGYLLAGPWVASALEERPTPRLGRFAVKRAALIVPAYWVAMLGSFWLLAVLSGAPLRGLGAISYGLYLWHLPVLLWLRFEGLMAGGFVVPWIEVSVLAAAVAYLSLVLVERPVMETADRWRPWTRRVPTFPAELHIKPLPSVA
jgi:peptidoglycan/LPS O-acetylase OafA/YrhL